MNVSGERSFAAPREVVWSVLNDPASMAKTMPGVEGFDVHDERRWTANVKIPLGLGGLKMKVDMDKTEEREPEFAKLDIKGKGVGAMLSMQTSFELSEQEGGTLMKWAADVKIAGPVGSMGQRVIQPIVNQQVAHVLGALEREVQSSLASGGTAPSTGPAPSQGSGDASGGGAGLAGHDVTPGDEVELPAAEGPKDYGPPAPATTDPEPPSGTSGAEDGTSPLEPDAYEG